MQGFLLQEIKEQIDAMDSFLEIDKILFHKLRYQLFTDLSIKNSTYTINE